MLPSAALAWGGRTHEIINRRAVERLPEPARSTWAVLAEPIGRHASDADHRKSSDPQERFRHYIDIDVYEDHPFDGVSRDLNALVRQHGREHVDQFGTVPWAIEECYRMTVLSLQRGDWGSAAGWAADLGHYVGDAHQPLHCTVNYDGQNTGNDGVHLRFEVTMMDRYFDEGTIELSEPVPAAGDPVPFCFRWIAEAYPHLEAMLAADTEATRLDPDFGDAYYGALWERTREMATLQVSRAVRDLSALYLQAWEEAGSPPGPSDPPPVRMLPREVLEPSAPGLPRPAGRAWWVAAIVLVGAFLSTGT